LLSKTYTAIDSKNKKLRLGLIGARIDGHAGVIIDVLSLFEDIEIVAFFDSTPDLKGTCINNIPVLGCIHDATQDVLDNIDEFHISIGDNKARQELFIELKMKGLKFSTIIHPTAVISNSAIIGEGCFIGALAVVQCNVTISNVSLINTAAVIEHDNIIGEAVHIAPNAATAGRVKIGDLSFVGIGASIIPDIIIGESVFVAAGAVITKDVKKNTRMLGYFAKPHHENIYADIDNDNDN